MIITLTKADFSALNVGTLTTWYVFKSLGRGVTYEGVNSVNRDELFLATLTIAEGYELLTDSVNITMGGQPLDSNALVINENIITISIANVTGNINISVPTKAILPEVSEPEIPVNPPTEPEEPEGGNTSDTDVVINYALNTQMSDKTGAFEGVGNKARIVTTSVLQINKGNTITLANELKDMEFLAYTWQDAKGEQFLGYVDCDPNNAYGLGNNNNWSRDSFTFDIGTKATVLGGATTYLTDDDYPVYVRLVFRPIGNNPLPTLDALSDRMTYNIAGYLDNFEDSPIRITETTTDGINYALNYRYVDSTGAVNDNDQGYDARAIWTTPIKVSVGDNIKINNPDVEFLLYAYSNADEAGKDSNYLGYPLLQNDKAAGKWSQDFTIAADTLFSKGSANGQTLTYPVYVRGLFKSANGLNSPLNLADIASKMVFTIADTNE